MTSPRAPRDFASDAAGDTPPLPRYPVNHVLAVIDTPAQLRAALDALESGGFTTSDIGVRCGEAMADALAAGSGRTGLSDLVMRFSEWIGLTNDEMAVKNRYEAALRDGQFIVSVAAETDERRDDAARLVREHGAHFVNFLGQYTMIRIAP
jgi:hypothetical protein